MSVGYSVCKCCGESKFNVGCAGVCSSCEDSIEQAIKENEYETLSLYGRYGAIELITQIQNSGTINYYAQDTLKGFFDWINDKLNKNKKKKGGII